MQIFKLPHYYFDTLPEEVRVKISRRIKPDSWGVIVDERRYFGALSKKDLEKYL